MNNQLKRITVGEFLLWLVRRRHRFRVLGNSMLPLLKPGDELLIIPNAYKRSRPTPGDIVVAAHPRRPDVRLVKRVASVTEDGHCTLLGDNPLESTDSRDFGPVPAKKLLGQVACRFG